MPEDIGLPFDILEMFLNTLEFLALVASVVTFFFLMLNKFLIILNKLLAPYGLGFWARLRVLFLCRRSPVKKRAFLEFALLKTEGRRISHSDWRTIINQFKAHYIEGEPKQSYALDNCMPLLGEPFTKAVQAYFDLFRDKKVKKAFGIREDAVLEWVTTLRIEEAYATPTCLLTGLLARYEENWGDFIQRYVSTAYMTDLTRDGQSRILSNELYMTFAWLLWGPSYEIEHTSYWSGLCQLSFGDESNSVPAIAAPDIAPAMAEMFKKNSGKRYGELISADLSLSDGKQYIKQIRSGILPEETYFYEKMQEQLPFVLKIEKCARSEGYKSKRYYCTAYAWLLFELEDENSYDFKPENSVAFFEHVNLTDAPTYQFLTEALLKKSVLHFRQVFSEPGYADRKYRFVCAFNKYIENKFKEAYTALMRSDDDLADQFASRIILEPKRSPADAFAAFDEFFSKKTQYQFIEVSADDKATITELANFYTEIYMDCFRNVDERESFDNLLKYLKNSQNNDGYSYHIVLAKDSEGVIVAGAIFDYFKRSNCAVVEFVAVRQNLQSGGVGSAMYKHVLTTLSSDAYKNGKRNVDYIFCEIEAPGYNDAPIKKYLYFWQKYKFRHIRMQYIQPALSHIQKPVHGLWLTVAATDKNPDKISTGTVLDVIADYMRYSMQIPDPDKCAEFLQMSNELEGRTYVDLEPIIQ